MKFGLSEKEFLFLNQNLIVPFVTRGFKVYIFGSRAKAKSHKFSDVDILIEGSFDLESLQFLSQIQELFEESRFPYKVDLVKESDLAESYKADVFSSRIQIG